MQQKCETQYIYVEMILNKETKYDVVAGLFKGIVKKKDEIFILLHGLKDATAVLNTKFYNIMSLEVMEDEYKNMTYLTFEKRDQELGSQMLEELNTMLLDNNFGMKNDAKIIDIDKYKDVPTEYKDGKSINKTVGEPASRDNGVGSFASSGNRYKAPTSGVTYGKTYTKKEIEPRIFSRTKSKKPTKTALELMREKIELIMNGNYEHELPETLGESENSAEDDDESRFYCDSMYGGRCY